MKNNSHYYAKEDCCYGNDYRKYYRTSVLLKWANTAKEKAEKHHKPNPAADIFSVLCENFNSKNEEVNLNSKEAFYLFRKAFIKLGYNTVLEAQKDNEELYSLFWSSTVAFLEEMISYNRKLSYLVEKLNSINTPFDFATDIVGSYVTSKTFLTKISSDDAWSYLFKKINWTLSSEIEYAENIICTLDKKERLELKRKNKEKVFDDEKEEVPILYLTSIDGPAFDDDSDTTISEIIESDEDEVAEEISKSFADAKATEFFKHLSAPDIVLCTILKEGRLPHGYRKFLDEARCNRSETEFFEYMLKQFGYISDENIAFLAKHVDPSCLNAMESWCSNSFSNHVRKITSKENCQWFKSDCLTYHTPPKKSKTKKR